jgi:zinc protease
VFAQIDSVKATGASADDLTKVKEMQLRGWETSLKQNGFWLSQLAAYDQAGEDPRAILDYRATIGRLTAERIRDAARRYLNTGNYVRVTLHPEQQGGAKSATQEAAKP